MATEYYQIPSQQGLLPLDSNDVDPWLVAATSNLSLNDWSVKNKVHSSVPSLFEPDEAESALAGWKPSLPVSSPIIKPPKAPKQQQFNPTSSKIDAWSVADTSVLASPTTKKQSKVVAAPTAAAPDAEVPEAEGEDGKATIEDELAHQNRYKTELCKSFTETGSCRYGAKCQFAHGKEEVRPILRHPKYKTEICKTFHTTGTCPYGIRCRFIHTKSKEESILSVPKSLENDDDESTPTPSVAKWSKSWNVSVTPTLAGTKKGHLHRDLDDNELAF